jgi:hypothetical protein
MASSCHTGHENGKQANKRFVGNENKPVVEHNKFLVHRVMAYQLANRSMKALPGGCLALCSLIDLVVEFAV